MQPPLRTGSSANGREFPPALEFLKLGLSTSKDDAALYTYALHRVGAWGGGCSVSTNGRYESYES